MDELIFIKRKKGTVLLLNGRQHYKQRAYKNDASIWNCSLVRKEKCRGSVTIQRRHVAVCALHRSWLGAPFAALLLVSVAYYWWLVSRITILETHNHIFRTQFRSYDDVVQMRALSVNSDSSYVIPEIPDEVGTICETIHIAIVSMGKINYLTPMLKSLLYHRQNPLHFHLICDADSEVVINKLFDTWDLPDVKYTCYNGQDYISKVSWIPLGHYSGVYILLKLFYSSILPQNLTKVIALDSDLTFLSDVALLWAMFRNMSDSQLIGVVENESDWYTKSSSWPALGRGYNTGVMLLHLNNIRTNSDWSGLWHEALEDNLKQHTNVALGDQDIINAVIKKHPHIVYNISCHYNVQMSTLSLAKFCYGEDVNDVKILHWNSPQKLGVTLADAGYFRSRHRAFVHLDGGLLRRKLHRCWHSAPEPTPPPTDVCGAFRAASLVRLRTLLARAERAHDAFDVTLALQLSMDRLPFLERLAGYWEGPLSAAIYLSDCEVPQLESFIRNSAASLNARTNVAYHLVFKDDAVHYPVNYLRNVALEHVGTPYVFLMDADFVPAAGLYRQLRAALRLVNPYPMKKCLVVPAFESQRYRATPPRSKPALLARLGGPDADVAPFRAREWPRGHRATDYAKWAAATAPYEVEWEPDYEPYLVVHRSVPKYDTRFSGFGWNKVSHIVELRARGYRAVVLPAAFIVHTTHAPSADITAFRQDKNYRICLALLKNEFLQDLSRRYNVSLDEHKSDPAEGGAGAVEGRGEG